MAAFLSLVTAAVAALFAASVLDQFLERRRPFQLVWSVGLGLYAVASLLQAAWLLGAESEVVFRLWYLTGAMLVAAYLGAGSVYLHARPAVGHGVMVVLAVLTVVSAVLALGIPLRADLSGLQGGSLASLDPGSNVRFFPTYVGVVTAFLNSVGAALLVGSAVYSAAVYALRRSHPHRVLSNALIAVGAIVSSAGGTLERFDMPQAHVVALLVGIVIIFLGFLRSREVFMSYRIPFLGR